MNTVVLITGCQRSGTTLLRLILDSHPGVYSVDEDKFHHHEINTLQHAPWLPGHVALKLPQYAPLISFITSLPERRVLWCIRDPLDTVLSMLKLETKFVEGVSLPWAAHPAGAPSEITNCYWSLTEESKRRMAEHMGYFGNLLKGDPARRSRSDMIFLAALCWRIKNELPRCYEEQGIGYHTVKYEGLVSDPKAHLLELTRYLGLPWDDNLMRHHEMHSGVSIGDTSNTRAIDRQNVGKGAKTFSREEVALIANVCGSTASSWGYEIAQ